MCSSAACELSQTSVSLCHLWLRGAVAAAGAWIKPQNDNREQRFFFFFLFKANIYILVGSSLVVCMPSVSYAQPTHVK